MAEKPTEAEAEAKVSQVPILDDPIAGQGISERVDVRGWDPSKSAADAVKSDVIFGGLGEDRLRGGDEPGPAAGVAVSDELT